MTLTSFQKVRERAAKFCTDRDWQKFHLPTNIVMALAGECGEVCEIFQWKGSLENNSPEENMKVFSDKEQTNIGEEIADVFIYSTRLSDICQIDLAHAIRKCLEMETSKTNSYQSSVKKSALKWDDLSFDELNTQLVDVIATQKSQRHVALFIQVEMGKICELFCNKSETENIIGLSPWSKKETARLATHLGTICILLSCLASLSNHTLSRCISDKITKNETKYPVHLVRGSSAKYTDYIEKIQSSEGKPLSATQLAVVAQNEENARRRKAAFEDVMSVTTDTEERTSDVSIEDVTKPPVLSSEEIFRKKESERINRIITIMPILVVLVGIVAVVLGYVMGQMHT